MNKVLVNIGLNALKMVVLQILNEYQAPASTPGEILRWLDIPPVKDNDGSITTLVRGILAHLADDGHAVYIPEECGWRITPDGISFIDSSKLTR